jgi:hypothetical protein
MRALGHSTETLDLNFLMADLLEEQRIPASTAAKGMANRAFNNPKGPKKNQNNQNNKKGSNSKNSPKKDDSKPTYGGNGSQKGQKKKRKPFSNQTEGYTCIIGSYNIDSGRFSNDSSSSSNSSSESDFDELLPISYRSREVWPKKPPKEGSKTKQSPCKDRNCNHQLPRDVLLYDTGSTDYIINERKWFTEDYKPNKGELGPLATGGGPIVPKGKGTAVFRVKVSENPEKYQTLTLRNALYFPFIDVNLFSGIKHYKAGGYLEKETLKSAKGTTIGLLNFQKSGFFLQLEGLPLPKLYLTSYSHIARPSAQPTNPSRIVVELPTKSENWKDSFSRFEELEEPTVGPNSGSTTIGPARKGSRGKPEVDKRPRSSGEPLGLGAPGKRAIEPV